MENGPTFVAQMTKLLSTTIEVFARDTGNKLIREDALSRDQLFTFEDSTLGILLGVLVGANGEALHASSDTGRANRDVSVLVSGHEAKCSKNVEISEQELQMVEANMSKLVMKTKQQLCALGQERVGIISHTRIGQLLDCFVNIMKTSQKRHESVAIDGQWQLSSTRDVQASLGPGHGEGPLLLGHEPEVGLWAEQTHTLIGVEIARSADSDNVPFGIDDLDSNGAAMGADGFTCDSFERDGSLQRNQGLKILFERTAGAGTTCVNNEMEATFNEVVFFMKIIEQAILHSGQLRHHRFCQTFGVNGAKEGLMLPHVLFLFVLRACEKSWKRVNTCKSRQQRQLHQSGGLLCVWSDMNIGGLFVHSVFASSQ